MQRHQLIVTVLIVAVLLALAGCAGGGASETRPPATLRPGDRAQRIPAGHCRIMGIDIRKDNVSDVEAALGESHFYYRGDFDLGNCYVSRDGGFLEFFVSSNSIGYAVSKVLGNGVRAERCQSIAADSSDLVNEAGLRLGLSRDEIHHLLGPASRRSVDSNRYQYIFRLQERADAATAEKIRRSDQLPPDQEIWLNLYAAIRVYFEQDIVVGFEIDRSDAFR